MPNKRKSPKKRRPNGSGTIVKLKGNRENPYQVRVNTRLDDRGYPAYDVLGNYHSTDTVAMQQAPDFCE